MLTSIKIGESDFVSISDHQLILTPNVSSQPIVIEPINDNVFEEDVKNFTLFLSTNLQRIQLNHDSAIVSILDDDSKSACCVKRYKTHRAEPKYQSFMWVNDYYCIICNLHSNNHWVSAFSLCCE